MKFIPVTYDHRMVADANSYSPSAKKPAAVVSDWVERQLPIAITPVKPASVRTLEMAHHAGYVDAVLDCKIDNGFGNRSGKVAASLPWVVGSMVEAAIAAVTGKATGFGVACSPSAGFHHAGHARAAGFCTFNGLVITAMALKNLGLVRKVAIIDCDYHYGDGTQEIIDTLKLDFIQHWSAGLSFKHPIQAKDFMLGLAYVAKHTMAGTDLVLYQAGADQHRDDPLGGLLTTDELAQRDRTVFAMCREYDKPVAWNLAGGYQRDVNSTIEPVLALHRQTMQQCIDIFIRGQDLVL